MRLTFKELKDEISKIVPKSIDYRVDLEAGNIAIVTNEPEKFGGGDGLVAVSYTHLTLPTSYAV